MTMSAIESGKDIGEFGIYLYNTPTSARLSIVQIPAVAGGNVSIEG
jgi:hypothetical protein